MVTLRDRRRIARLPVPSQLSGRDLTLRRVRLLDLSLHGARIAHRAPLDEGRVCVVDLPPALGHGSLSGRIVWTQFQREEPSLAGAPQRAYQSGLTWVELTLPQVGNLATALTILQAHEHALDRACRRDSPPGGGLGERRHHHRSEVKRPGRGRA